MPLCLVYYCSGHGYGHATRVSAFSRLLLGVEDQRLAIYIVSSAPEYVFADSIACGAKYRYAEIDPVIVQPLAYRVDRRKSVEGLKGFLTKKDELLSRESSWLLQIRAAGVLSDAAFLGCLAAKTVGIPSLLITNFSFDSVYSFLSTQVLESESHLDTPVSFLDLVPDVPISPTELAPLVQQMYSGYQCADMLVRLPGYIPMPSFFAQPSLPSFEWVDISTGRLRPEILDSLNSDHRTQALHGTIPFSNTSPSKKHVTRSVIQAPLIVRPPSSNLSVYSREGRAKLLNSIGVPPHLHNPEETKILIVSFGGQVIKKPSRPPSRSSHSGRGSDRGSSLSPDNSPKIPAQDQASPLKVKNLNELGISQESLFEHRIASPTRFDLHIPQSAIKSGNSSLEDFDDLASNRLATPGHLWIPGAPPASKPFPTPNIQPIDFDVPTVNMIPATPSESMGSLADESLEYDYFPQLLPDFSWIAIVCGVSKEQWNSDGQDSDLPEGFYVAPKNVYMPDLTATADVLLGKLGYGTVSECVDACTPFVYVSRPLFVEEHGLRLLLDKEGVAVELSRQSYEAGDWASAIDEAYLKGKHVKAQKRYEMSNGINVDKREREGQELAKEVVDWFKSWWGA